MHDLKAVELMWPTIRPHYTYDQLTGERTAAEYTLSPECNLRVFYMHGGWYAWCGSDPEIRGVGVAWSRSPTKAALEAWNEYEANHVR